MHGLGMRCGGGEVQWNGVQWGRVGRGYVEES